MPTRKSDPIRFERCEEHLRRLDRALESYAAVNKMIIRRNQFDQPGRTLEISGNPLYTIDIWLSDPWSQIAEPGDLPHEVAVGAMFVLPTDDYSFSLRKVLAHREPFSTVIKRLPLYLEESARLIRKWTVDLLMREGEKSETAKKKFYSGL